MSAEALQREFLLFEISSPGRVGFSLPPAAVPPAGAGGIEEHLLRSEIEGFPELSEVDVVRHFTRLSRWNYAIDLGLGDYLMVILTATMASIGTAGVPGVGLIMLAMVLNQVGLPVEGIMLIIGVDRLLDMLRTAVNVVGDGTVATIVARSEDDLDLSVIEDPDAGRVVPPRA